VAVQPQERERIEGTRDRNIFRSEITSLDEEIVHNIESFTVA